MRPELHELLTREEELSEHEIDFTVQLCSELVQSHWVATHRAFEGSDVGDREVGEALSDQNFRTVYEIQFIWQMGLWRVLAIFDGVLSQWYPEGPRTGLKRKLDAVEASGRVIAREDRTELRNWMSLRNVLSHRPVEGHSLSHQLELADLQEVAALTRRILRGIGPSRISAPDA